MTQQIESREQRIMRPLLDFYSKEVNLNIILDIVVFKKHKIPLRLLDWFVTNYAKKKDVCYNIIRPNNRCEHFSVYRSYLAQLKGCKKKEFDPFCRGDTIMLQYDSPIDGSKIAFETAVCQLKFFKWAIENLVIIYVQTHYDAIYDDMKAYSSKTQKIDRQNKRKKNELSASVFQQIHFSNQAITFNFTSSKLQ